MSHLPGLPHPGASGDRPGPPPASHERVIRPHAAPPPVAISAPSAAPVAPAPVRRRPEHSPFSPTNLFYAYLLPDEDPWKTETTRRRRTPPA